MSTVRACASTARVVSSPRPCFERVGRRPWLRGLRRLAAIPLRQVSVGAHADRYVDSVGQCEGEIRSLGRRGERHEGSLPECATRNERRPVLQPGRRCKGGQAGRHSPALTPPSATGRRAPAAWRAERSPPGPEPRRERAQGRGGKWTRIRPVLAVSISTRSYSFLMCFWPRNARTRPLSCPCPFRE